MQKKRNEEFEQKIVELTADLQRQRADFENYRKRVEAEKAFVKQSARSATILQLLPIIDTIERATVHVPADLAENAWAQGVVGLGKNLQKTMADFGLERIEAEPGTPFDPELHEAVATDEAEGEQEVVAEVLRDGYKLDGQIVRPSMVKVTRQ